VGEEEKKQLEKTKSSQFKREGTGRKGHGIAVARNVIAEILSHLRKMKKNLR